MVVGEAPHQPSSDMWCVFLLVCDKIKEAQEVPPTYDQQGAPRGYSAQEQYPPQQGQYPPQQQAYYPNQGYPAPAGYAAVHGECVDDCSQQ